MRLNSKGQVTIPAELRRKHRLHEGDEVEVVEEGGALRIVRVERHENRTQRWAREKRGSASSGLSTDELMELLRGE
ncbi:AbrB family looped-hinge helix DNA binding protein [Kribbella amoyensis]|uniref:AbrB family looped-hinge helix DNA binding protein n=1 Tax=Kribbella amoyensis TaxID=996641 RepID=A0A561BQB9_9ACTN|nr:AbrB/MazE/SpoVT family DNA-binding domain-containing protein [Kribbella amoyensis]TWD81060.1 AbrB family looped-hinge helix DNA binding protein [Kribbella amoyensis]